MRIFLILLLISGCFYPSSPTTTTHKHTIGKEDHETQLFIQQKIGTIDTTATKQLISQLSTTTCTLQLPSTNSQKTTATTIYNDYKDSVVIVAQRYKCSNCDQWHIATSSGFMISDSGACVTSYHVINNRNAERFIIVTTDKKCYGIDRVLAADKPNDFVILQLKGHNFPPPLALSKPIVGTNVYVISHPQSRYYSLTSGMISRIFTPENRPTQTPYITITADYATGSSGAPIFDEYANVVGVVSYTQSAYAQQDVQMVFKNATNAQAILKTINTP